MLWNVTIIKMYLSMFVEQKALLNFIDIVDN